MKESNAYEVSELKKKLRETEKKQIHQRKIEEKKGRQENQTEEERAESQISQNRGESALSKAGSKLNLKSDEDE